MIIIDAKDMIVGRVATVAAKKALQGAEVAIINSEQAVFTGNKKRIVTDWQEKYAMGVPRKGPFINRMPDRFLRRVIRGMLPYKKPRGAEAYKRIMCYLGEPKGLKGEKMVIQEASVDKLPTMKYLTVDELCKKLGGSHGQE